MLGATYFGQSMHCALQVALFCGQQRCLLHVLRCVVV